MKKNLIVILISVILTAVYYLLTPYKAVMTAVSEAALTVKQFICSLCSLLHFSVAEILVIVCISALFMFLILSVVAVIKAKRRGYTFLRRLTLFVSILTSIYLLLCVFLNASYHADNFQDMSGIKATPSSVDELYKVTSLFVSKLTDSCGNVSRDEKGLFNVPVDTILDESVSVYKSTEGLFPFLKMKDAIPKPVMFSRLMSRFNYTGFYFPFTGEANINTDVIRCMIPATAAHEMAHQRGIASEQEANFVAILACSESGNPDYEYSGWLLGYINLGNALYSCDSERYFKLAALLPEPVKADIRANNDYWAKFDTKEAKVSEKLYDSFLKGNGQELGVQSYGAVVDLLIAWNKKGGFK